MRPQIAPLTGIRGIAATWVVLLHIQLLLPELLPRLPVVAALLDGGNLGVDLFFILSGFIISLTYLERLHKRVPGDVSRYLWLRVARIYPTHLFMVAVVVVMVAAMTFAGSPPADERRFSALSFIMNLFMLQAVPPALAWNDPAWSISTEFAAYLAFPLLVPLLMRVTPRAALIGLVVLLASGTTGLWFLVQTAHEWPFWSGYVLMWARIAVCFPVGCLLFIVWRSRPADGWIGLSNIILPIALAGTVATCLLSPPAEGIALPVLAYPFLAATIFALASATGPIARFLSSKPMSWSGRASYSVYLAHFPLLLVVVAVVGRFEIEPGTPLALLALAATLLAVLGAGAFAYHFVEEPSRRLIRRYVDGRANRRRAERTPRER